MNISSGDWAGTTQAERRIYYMDLKAPNQLSYSLLLDLNVYNQLFYSLLLDLKVHNELFYSLE